MDTTILNEGYIKKENLFDHAKGSSIFIKRKKIYRFINVCGITNSRA